MRCRHLLWPSGSRCDLAHQPPFRAPLWRATARRIPVGADQPPHRARRLVASPSCCRRSSPATTARLPRAGCPASRPGSPGQVRTTTPPRRPGAGVQGFQTADAGRPPGRMALGKRGVESFLVSRKRPPRPWPIWRAPATHGVHRAVHGRPGRSCSILMLTGQHDGLRHRGLRPAFCRCAGPTRWSAC